MPVRLHIFANGVEYIANALGKATPSINQATHDGAEIYFNVNFSSDVPVSFYAEVDPNNAISELNEIEQPLPGQRHLHAQLPQSHHHADRRPAAALPPIRL